MSAPYRGSCLCGAIQFEADALEREAAHCHCSMCRKFHGAPFATFGSIKRQNFRWTTGERELKTWRSADANKTERSFCRHCGSSLTFFSPRASGECIEMALAAFDDELPIQPDAHIFVDSGASWFDDSTPLPRYPAGRDTTPVVPHQRARLSKVTLVVRDYDEAIEFYKSVLGFRVAEDEFVAEQNKRWVVMEPPGGGTALVLGRAKNEQETAAIGNQTGGRVFLFLETRQFDALYARLQDKQVEIVRDRSTQSYGEVAVFADLYGNHWDLIGKDSGQD